MKLYEKLAFEYGINVCQRIWHGDDLSNAYRAGFLKAREMAADLADKLRKEEWFETGPELRQLGESEVGE